MTQDTPASEPLTALNGTWLALTEEAGGKWVKRADMVKKEKPLKVEGDKFTLSTTYSEIAGTITHVPAAGRNAIDLAGRYVRGGSGKDVLL